jgi:hypothetical protein
MKKELNKTAAIIDLHKRIMDFNLTYNDQLGLVQIFGEDLPNNITKNLAVDLRCAMIVKTIDENTIQFIKNRYVKPGVYKVKRNSKK